MVLALQISKLRLFKKHQRRGRLFSIVANREGQTTVEYLMLIAVAFSVAYLIITGPLGAQTSRQILVIRSVLSNLVQRAEMQTGNLPTPRQPNHPASRDRTRALHL